MVKMVRTSAAKGEREIPKIIIHRKPVGRRRGGLDRDEVVGDANKWKRDTMYIILSKRETNPRSTRSNKSANKNKLTIILPY